MKLYYASGACSLAIHILLEEIGKPYAIQKVDFANQEQLGNAFKKINPKSKVPVLEREDGSILTEFPAIALWLAYTNPEKLLPDDIEARVRVIELIDYVVSTVHMQGFTRFARPGNFSPEQAQHEQVKERGKQIFNAGLEYLDQQMNGREFFTGSFTIADATLFYPEFWSVSRLKQKLPRSLAAHFEAMKSRRAIQKVLEKEGLIL
jgi:glutathione S-transferase